MGTEKVAPLPKDKSMISNFDLFNRQIQVHFLNILLITSNLWLKFFVSFSTYTKPDVSFCSLEKKLQTKYADVYPMDLVLLF